MPQAISQPRGIPRRARHTPRQAAGLRMATEETVAAPAVSQLADWTTRAVAAYRRPEEDSGRALHQELARRLGRMIGSNIPESSVYVNPEECFAQAKVGAHLFRLQTNRLVLLTQCGHCGLGHFESPVIETLADLGYVLSVWQARCMHCIPEDPNNWLDADE